ncbi:hypothetical protein SOVF_040660 [Spinacia oleracea]|nr:hypothetical protein SOVF_040660 [Spinacia oleracea]
MTVNADVQTDSELLSDSMTVNADVQTNGRSSRTNGRRTTSMVVVRQTLRQDLISGKAEDVVVVSD